MTISYKRIAVYLLGMIILACGLTLNTKVTLGVSPLLALPFAVSQIFELNFANLVFYWYCIFILAELIIHYFIVRTKDRAVYVMDVLQIVISLIFTRIMNFIGQFIPVFETQCSGFLSTLPFRLLMLVLAIILTGTGAALTLNMKLVSNPGDGIVAAISEAIHKPVGTAKNIVDITCVIMTTIVSLLLAHKILGVGIGTLVAMLGVGRVIAFINRNFDLFKYRK